MADQSVPNWRDGLSEEQAQAASHLGSHARLLAGPGTGKSHTLARRIVYLVTEQEVIPSNILVLTFTRMATRELRTRIDEHLEPYTTERPHISTVHSFALRQLRRNSNLIDALPQPLRIADDWEEDNAINEQLKDILERSLKEVRDGFTRMSADWETLGAETGIWRADAQFIGAWQEHRRIYGYTLRSELVYQLKRALEQAPSFQLEPQFEYILIDEYQDLNPCDLAIARAMADRNAELMACGDDDQSIYGFRYADPSGIRGFLDQFGGALGLELSECRRCAPEILDAAMWVAEQDTRRTAKALRAAENNPRGGVHLLSFVNGGGEARGIATLSKKLIDSGIAPGKILVLVRSDRNGTLYSGPLKAQFDQLGIPVVQNTSERSPLDEAVGREFLAMLRLIANPSDHLAWWTRLRLTGGAGPKTLDAFYEFARTNGVTFSDAVHRFEEYSGTVPANRRKPTQEAISRTRGIIGRLGGEALPSGEDASTEGLLKWLVQLAEAEVPEEEGRLVVTDYLTEVAVATGARSLDELLVSVAVGRESLEAGPPQDAVSIMTMHQAKGLTVDAVFIMAAEDEILPRAEDAAAVEDDRRLLYVSMTRARKWLFITYCGNRTGAQAHSGRTTGEPRRSLTRFLRDAPIGAQPYDRFIESWIPNGLA